MPPKSFKTRALIWKFTGTAGPRADKRETAGGSQSLSKDTVAALYECLGATAAAAILPDFERVIGDVPTKRAAFAKSHKKTFVQSVEITRVRGEIQLAWESLRGRVCGDCSDLDGILESLNRRLTARIESFKRSEAALRTSLGGSGRGRPVNSLRIWLANTLFHLLVEHGVRLTKTKGAAFERVLIIAIDASRTPGDKTTPEDVMPLVRRTIDYWGTAAARWTNAYAVDEGALQRARELARDRTVDDGDQHRDIVPVEADRVAQGRAQPDFSHEPEKHDLFR